MATAPTYRYAPGKWITGPSSYSIEQLAAHVGYMAHDCDLGVIPMHAGMMNARYRVEIWAKAKPNQSFTKLKIAVLAAGNIILEEDPALRRVLIARST